MKWFWLLVPGGSVVLLGLWAHRRWLARADALIDAEIAAKASALQDRRRGQVADDSRRVRTKAKRKAADEIRMRAARVESGSPVSDVLRRVK